MNLTGKGYKFPKGHSIWLGRKHRPETIKKMQTKGGRSRSCKEGYYSTEHIKWRKAIFERDNFTCQNCGRRGNKVYLTAHHLKSWAEYPTLRFELTNGQTLCEYCHKLTDNYKGRNKKKHIKIIKEHESLVSISKKEGSRN